MPDCENYLLVKLVKILVRGSEILGWLPKDVWNCALTSAAPRVTWWIV